MKPFKLLLLTLAISAGTVIYAEGIKKIYDLNGLSAEIEHILRDAHQNLEEGSTVTVFFSVAEDKSIQYVSVASGKPEICNLLRKKLQSQKLDGTKWREGVIYELSIVGRSPVAGISH
ncbi:hypothetical protein JRG66_00115 [Salinimicrobium tongyeongense]|jgi:hypothetical protein|uniref:Uncharacterized protein n=1 Tax=Salinimicrobium tongyeongense TaxID=2809707 RepID=A0ABY6NS88_9FLAO|nr:hypothetical protein [Salinimicrobium tongyeongense]UZH55348.1 hypothetical protein JRG66_00115 [Salinimicrobium tongyeongense]